MRAMTVKHERWEEFVHLLAGPEGCNFQRDANGKVTWRCAGGNDKSLAVAALQQMGGDIDIPASLAYFEQHGGYCDCEILFNVDRPCEVPSKPMPADTGPDANGLDLFMTQTGTTREDEHE